jgi:hypothetical protein
MSSKDYITCVRCIDLSVDVAQPIAHSSASTRRLEFSSYPTYSTVVIALQDVGDDCDNGSLDSYLLAERYVVGVRVNTRAGVCV